MRNTTEADVAMLKAGVANSTYPELPRLGPQDFLWVNICFLLNLFLFVTKNPT